MLSQQSQQKILETSRGPITHDSILRYNQDTARHLEHQCKTVV